MWRIFYFAQLPGQYWLFGIPFHVQTNCSRFVEHTLAKSWRWKSISYILADKNEKIFSFFIVFIFLKLKNYQCNTDIASCNLFQCSRNLFVKFYYEIKQPIHPPTFRRMFLKNIWLVIFGESPRNFSIRYGTALWIFTAVRVILFSV